MKEKFKISTTDSTGIVYMFEEEYETYPLAMQGIAMKVAGEYQIQKIFVKS